LREGQANGALEHRDPERIGLLLFATTQGIAALVTADIVAPEQVDTRRRRDWAFPPRPSDTRLKSSVLPPRGP
jgi:hypothetical protein